MRRPISGITLAVLALLTTISSSPAWAGSTIVSANPHEVDCNVAQPQAAIASYAGVNANAYHFASSCEVTTILAFPSPAADKPRIVSSDGANGTVAEYQGWIDQVWNASAHFEHFAGPMVNLALTGATIDGIEDFDSASVQILQKLGSRATWLSSNGTLTQSGTGLYWNGQPVTLMGFSLPGILVGKNINLPKYLDVLASKGVNFLRLDAIDQWTALTVGASQLNPANGLTPFVAVVPGSSGSTLTTKWDLNQLNTEYFNRAKDLVSLAAERGIVVQFSMFDRHGLLNMDDGPLAKYGRFYGSPYNKDNNNNLDSLGNKFLAAGPVGKAPADFTGMDGTTIGGINKAYLQRLVKEVGAYGNLIFEIMNEPRESAADWSNTAAWHQWVADTVHAELAKPLVTMPMPKAQSAVAGSTASFTVMVSGVPAPSFQWQVLSGGSYVSLADDGRIQGSQTATLRIGSVAAADATSYRCIVSGTGVSPALNSGPASLQVIAGGLVVKDGFGNGENTLLNGRVSEAGGKTWAADDVKISGQKARSNNDAGKTRIVGSVPVSLAGFQSAGVQAEVRQSATGYASIGFRSTALGAFEGTDNSLWLDMSRAGVLTLNKRVAGSVSALRTLSLSTLGFAVDSTVHLRLVYKVATATAPARADVYVNHVKRMNDVPLGFTPATSFAGFQGRRGVSTDTYLDTSGELDNFEAVLSPQ